MSIIPILIVIDYSCSISSYSYTHGIGHIYIKSILNQMWYKVVTNSDTNSNIVIYTVIV